MATAIDDWETTILTKVHRQLRKGAGSLRILITGRTGVGKSALVNSIVGKYVAEEIDSPCYGQTKEVTKYESVIQGDTVTVFDTPGFQDGIDDKNGILKDQKMKYLKALEENCIEVDLNLYCVKMNDKLRPGEYSAITKLSHAFGMDELWQNTLFVLTFANEITLPKSESSSTLSDHFKKKMSEWKTILQDILTNKAGITKEVAENVPIVPAGYFDEPSLPAANCDFWLSKLWFQCLDRKEDIKNPILLKINWGRLQTLEEDIPKKKGYEQPINQDDVKEKSTKTADDGKFTSIPQDQQPQAAKLSAPPTLAKLQVLENKGKEIRIIEKMAAKWLKLGDLLEFDDYGATLNNIEQEYEDPSLCCREMFQYWIGGGGVRPCSWEKLIELIDDCGEVVMAQDIKNALSA